MRKTTNLVILMILCSLKMSVHAQVSVTIPIDYDAAIGYHGSSNANNNYGSAIQNAAYAISDAAGLNVNRALIHFDLSSLPAGAQIISAKLNLYSTGPLGSLAGSQGNNGALLQRIVKAWGANTVTWNTQPDSTSTNQVVLPPSIYADQDYLNIDIFKLVKDIQLNGNYGLILKLINEVNGNALLFCSADYSDQSKHPTVTIQYRMHEMSAGNYDAAIGYNGDSNADNNYGSALQNGAYAFPGSVSGYNVNRALIHFDLSKIPAGAVITSAKLNLHATGPIGNSIGHTGNANSALLQRVTETWTEYGATWNNQPAATSSNQVVLPSSTSATQDYLGIDVKQLVSDMLSYGNNGFLLKMASQTSPNGLLFCSFDYPDTLKHPSLEVQYYVKQTLSEDYDAAIGYNGASGADTNYGDALQNAAYCISNLTKKSTDTTLPSQNLQQNVNRALMHFNLNSVPKDQFLLTAKLNLYATGPIGNVSGHLGSNNASVLQAATDNWTASTVTWNTQPASTEVDQVILPQSKSATQDYLGINVKNLVSDMIKNKNNGFLLKLVDEQPSNGLLFCSSNYTDNSKHPILEVVFGTPRMDVSTDSLTVTGITPSNSAIMISSNANWTVASNQNWLTISTANGSEDQTVTLTSSINPTMQSRTAVVAISVPGAINRTIIITQNAGSPTLSLSSTNLSIPAASSTNMITVNSNTNWTVTEVEPWITINKTTGSGDETFTFTVTDNTVVAKRSVTLVFSAEGVADQNLTLTQEAAIPVINVSTSTLSFRASTNLVQSVSITSNTDWAITSDQTWLTINKATGTGDENLSLSASPNTSNVIRTATVSIKVIGLPNKTITVNQDGTTGIGDIKANSVLLYPNPVRDILFFNENLNDCKISVIDSKGSIVLSKQINDGKIDLSKLSSGNYIVRIMDKSGVTSKSIIKE